MRQTEDPDLIDYLAAENAWADERTAHLADLRPAIERELRAVLPDEDVSAPQRRGGYDYRIRRPAGAQYRGARPPPRRQPRTPAPTRSCSTRTSSPRATTSSSSASVEPSPDGAGCWPTRSTIDGSEVYTLRVRDLRTGEDLPDEVPGTYYGLAWAADAASLLLHDARRRLPAGPGPPARARHGRSPRTTVVWHEEDRRFELEVDVTRSGALVRLVARSRDTTEVRLVPTDDLSARPDPGRSRGRRT